MQLDETGTRICAFLESIGIPVRIAPIDRATVLPGIDIARGGLLLDPAQLRWPGDLLHEAGHIAVTAPDLRPALSTVPSDGGEEMAAIAWSYAAALAIGIAPEIVLHDDGYQGGGTGYAAAFAQGNGFGIPLLQYWGMTTDPKHAAPGQPSFPAMHRWLR